MLIGVPKEIKPYEFRAGLTPSGVGALTRAGHQVLVQEKAGTEAGFDDSAYRKAGGLIVAAAEEIYEKSDMIVKVKEPQPEECAMIRTGQILFCYLHLAAEPKIASALIDRNCIAIAYETVTDDHGDLPLLAPMSRIAGTVAMQSSMYFLQKPQGGKGILPGSVTGVARGHAVILGAGAAGSAAAVAAAGAGMRVSVLDLSYRKLDILEQRLGAVCDYIVADEYLIDRYVSQADITIGAVLVPGAAAPKAVLRDTVKKMEPGSVIADISIDQGGCIETSRPTTSADPIYVEEGVIHYCVTNIPGTTPQTSIRALENASLPYVLTLANLGYRAALSEYPHLRNGLNIFRGRVTHEQIANALNYPYVPASSFLDMQSGYFG